jgi:hypothetical protein
MTSTAIVDRQRQERAASALMVLGRDQADRQVLLIECRRGHTLAAIYSTDAGLVFLSRPRPNMLDEQDLAGLQHHRSNCLDHGFTDMLQAPWVDDDLPAGCYCGNRTLSRLDIENDVKAGRQLVTVN